MTTTDIDRACRQLKPDDRARALFARMHTKGTMSELVGWRFVDYDGDALRLGFTPQPIFCNPMGMIHGGFVASMLDETMGSTIFAATDGRQIGATISATTDYVRPAMLGSLECVGRIRHQGKSIAFIEAELFDAGDRLLAKSSASFKLVAMP
ncbi:PaaI family thioesterase [Sphingomonas qilianensis]|uniref:PaaI family thioesterase n=1 Tax=Sphingomonas qilianensis TaxID=1736690 RepID=A0ABU9XMG4_9SPHN